MTWLEFGNIGLKCVDELFVALQRTGLIANPLFLLPAVCLRIQINPQNKGEFLSISPERAFADFLFAHTVLHLVVINFIGWNRHILLKVPPPKKVDISHILCKFKLKMLSQVFFFSQVWLYQAGTLLSLTELINSSQSLESVIYQWL